MEKSDACTFTWETDIKRSTENSYYLTDILDRALSSIWPGGVENEDQLYNWVFPFPIDTPYHRNQLRTVIKALTDEGLIYHQNGLYHVTYKGNMLIEETINTPYYKRPFRLAQVRTTMKSIWMVVKILAGAANAIAIVYLAWLQVRGSK